jgi:Kelch motif
MAPRILATSTAAAFLAFHWVTPASSEDDLSRHLIIDGEFEIQPYELPDGWRHLTSMINKAENELVLFGGLGDGPPFPPTPMNHNVYTLDLEKSPSEQQWEERSTDEVVPEPWFTTTRGFVQFGDRAYLACDDSEVNGVYAFDPVTYTFQLLSESTLDPQFKASDCCAIGVTLRNRSGSGEGEERIYMIGGGNEFASPLPYVRYYSITHDRWERVADLNLSRRHVGCASVKQRGKPVIYAIGGGDETIGEALRSIEVYDVIDDEWTLYDDFFPEGGGRTRMSVQNLDNRFLLVIGGDGSCTGGMCAPGRPLTTVDIIDVRLGNRLISSDEYPIPQLNSPRQTPATSLKKRSGHDQEDRYVLHVVGGQTVDPDDEEDGTDVLATTEVLSFNRIKVVPKRPFEPSQTLSLK